MTMRTVVGMAQTQSRLLTVRIAVALTLALLISPTANALVIDGRDWRQVSETVGVSWSQVAGACKENTGVCKGSIGNVLFDGWTWASVDDIRVLFDRLIFPQTVEFPTLDSSWGEFFGGNIDALIDESMFVNTYHHSPGIAEGVYGLSRSLYLDGDGTAHPLRPYLENYFLEGAGDSASLLSFAGKEATADWMGVWLYKSAFLVPEPNSFSLILASFAALLIVARNRRRGSLLSVASAR
ncbi:hypothetical protein PA01_18295 [Azoarcus sp. PA01]|nr:hypothetical protein PA01_19410 [Azoarcus sp. PA01]KAI5913734.1 hypothetical protein PA01_18295 [Azoarcus sp. PA01]